MAPTEADREKAREWLNDHPFASGLPDLDAVNILAELVAAGRAGVTAERGADAKLMMERINLLTIKACELESALDAERAAAGRMREAAQDAISACPCPDSTNGNADCGRRLCRHCLATRELAPALATPEAEHG
jgi:hypothetical protein